MPRQLATNDRGLEKVKEQLRAGDTLVVWRLDRLGRSLRDLIGWMTYLEDQKVGLLSLHEAIDTTTSSGKLTFISSAPWQSSSAI